MQWDRLCRFGFGIGSRRPYYFGRYGADWETGRRFFQIVNTGDPFDDSR